MNRRHGAFWWVGIGCVIYLGGCVAKSSDVGTLNPDENGGGGSSGGGSGECTPGSSEERGCNTCTCNVDGSWICTRLACLCTEGETRSADDGCNTCTCEDGAWSCTTRGCAACTVGDTRSDGCTSCVCMELEDGPAWACTANQCAECSSGEMRTADDGCNACVCDSTGSWQCTTDRTCGVCSPGEARAAGDGCNTCFCGDDGRWDRCTMVECQPLTCSEGFADCNAVSEDGCETEIASAVDHCGACGLVCVFAGASAACVEGQCAIAECDAGYGDCNGDASDGCEVPVGDGSCSSRCDVPVGSAGPVPATGSCECPPGMGCVRGSVEDEDGEYCFPLPEGCGDHGSCGCLGSCVCPEDSQGTCSEEMTIGAMIVNCAGRR